MEQSSIQIPPDEKKLADKLRNQWKKKTPRGLSKRDVEVMTDEDILDCYYISNETIEDILENAVEIRKFGSLSDDDFS